VVEVGMNGTKLVTFNYFGLFMLIGESFSGFIIFLGSDLVSSSFNYELFVHG